jgi:hypothetical protein
MNFRSVAHWHSFAREVQENYELRKLDQELDAAIQRSRRRQVEQALDAALDAELDIAIARSRRLRSEQPKLGKSNNDWLQRKLAGAARKRAQ